MIKKRADGSGLNLDIHVQFMKFYWKIYRFYSESVYSIAGLQQHCNWKLIIWDDDDDDVKVSLFTAVCGNYQLRSEAYSVSLKYKQI